MQKKISIIIATLNAEETLQKAINSVVNQSFSNIELIIIDGVSRDSTITIIEQNKNVIAYWESTYDKGIYDALNKGISKCTGDWILFLGADDELFSVSIIDDVFASANILPSTKLIYGKAFYTKRSNLVGECKDILKLINSNICHQAIFYHRSLFNSIGYFSNKYAVLADYEFNLRVFKLHFEDTLFVNEIICKFNDIGVTTSKTVLDKYFHADMLFRFCQEWGINRYNYVLHQYYFFSGIILIKSSFPSYGKGLYNILLGIILSRKRMGWYLALCFVLLFRKKTILR